MEVVPPEKSEWKRTEGRDVLPSMMPAKSCFIKHREQCPGRQVYTECIIMFIVLMFVYFFFTVLLETYWSICHIVHVVNIQYSYLESPVYINDSSSCLAKKSFSTYIWLHHFIKNSKIKKIPSNLSCGDSEPYSVNDH